MIQTGQLYKSETGGNPLSAHAPINAKIWGGSGDQCNKSEQLYGE